MAFYFPPIVPKKDDKKVNTDRSQELENLLGNYFITDHQRTRLTSRIIDFIKSNPDKSTFMMRSDEIEPKWFEVTLSIKQIKMEPQPELNELEEEEEDVVDESTTIANTDETTHFP